MVAVSNKNWAHIISTPLLMSWSWLITREVKASTTAAKKLLIATKDSAFLSCIILLELKRVPGIITRAPDLENFERDSLKIHASHPKTH